MKSILVYNLPEDEEPFAVATKAMDWALLAWDIEQELRNLITYNPAEFETGVSAFDHIRAKLADIMDERGLQFPS